MPDFFEDVIAAVCSGVVKDKKQLQRYKNEAAARYSLSSIPSDADILEHAGKYADDVRSVLQKKASRTLSGIAAVAVMTQPAVCPGTCIYCPGGVKQNTPQSYTGHEPAAMRGSQYDFDAYEQVKNRIAQLGSIGHGTDKVELIIMGGTFPSQPEEYQRDFVKKCFDAMNASESASLAEAQQNNEASQHRCVGMTIETRPDYCRKNEINMMLSLGATRVELGVQHPDDDIYMRVKRGHTVKDVVESTALLKDSLLKVNYHIMPNLPGSDLKKDAAMFDSLFTNEDYMPDMLKIYPCLLVKEEYGRTGLHDLYDSGEWRPYSEDETAELIASAQSRFPRWVRVMRVQRDIPSPLVKEGVKHSNLRQLVDDKMHELGLACNCIRCREIGVKSRVDGFEPDWDNIAINVAEYKSSGGKEFFISADEKTHDALVGFARLRFPVSPFRPELQGAAGIRELHVYGAALQLGARDATKAQHKGFGRALLERAEQIAKEEYDKIAVISGVGVRPYYYKLGYERDGPYVSKKL